jgi:hypothetical protein
MTNDRPLRAETAPGVFTDLGALARDAAIQTVARSDAPISDADDLVAAVTGAALQAVVAARVRLFVQGHTPSADELLPILWMPFEAQQHAALASAQIGLTAQGRDLAAAEASLALTAATCMAAIDRLRSARGAA